MDERPTEEDGRRALRDHVADKAAAARAAHPEIGTGAGLEAFLADAACVRYPVTLEFDSRPLEPGEFATLEPAGKRPADGFVLFLHPSLRMDERAVSMATLYHIPSVNYGEIVTSDDAELFGATAMGMEVEAYYKDLCALADGLA